MACGDGLDLHDLSALAPRHRLGRLEQGKTEAVTSMVGMHCHAVNLEGVREVPANGDEADHGRSQVRGQRRKGFSMRRELQPVLLVPEPSRQGTEDLLALARYALVRGGYFHQC